MLRIMMNYVVHSYVLFVEINVELVEDHYVLYPNKLMKLNLEKNVEKLSMLNFSLLDKFHLKKNKNHLFFLFFKSYRNTTMDEQLNNSIDIVVYKVLIKQYRLHWASIYKMHNVHALMSNNVHIYHI